jgi:hypothetical protein
MNLYMFRGVPLSIIRNYSLYAQQWYKSYRFVDSFRERADWNPDPARKVSVQWITPDDGQRNCPKHVEFHFKNKIWEISASSWFYYKETPHVVYQKIVSRWAVPLVLCYRECVLSVRGLMINAAPFTACTALSQVSTFQLTNTAGNILGFRQIHRAL